MSGNDTIYALSTPPGRSGIAVVRVSGVCAGESLAAFSGKPLESFPPYQMKLATLTDPVSRETIDQAMAVYFKAPHGFTGEDAAEYYLHGGPAVIQSMLAALSVQKGHRLAEAGEFTRRAFENGKLDLTEAEAVADLIHAETALQKQQALSQLDGRLSQIYNGWAEALKKALGHIEADLEFPDEDLPEGMMPEIRPVLERLRDEISGHLDDNRRGERLRDGIKIAVIGAPNAGKSSLVNALAQRDVAIVSSHAGTTRDVIDVNLDIGGYPVILSDTAGLRPDQIGQTGQEGIESEGIRRALKKAEEADIRLLMFDAAELPDLDQHTLALATGSAAQTLIVLNKCELAQNSNIPQMIEGMRPIMISAQNGEGLDSLLGEVLGKMNDIFGMKAETSSLTRERHRAALSECLEAIERALSAPLPELTAEDIRLAVRALGKITGRVHVEDVLDVIFRDFCIGK